MRQNDDRYEEEIDAYKIPHYPLFLLLDQGRPLTLLRKLDHAVLEILCLLQPGLGRLFGKLSGC